MIDPIPRLQRPHGVQLSTGSQVLRRDPGVDIYSKQAATAPDTQTWCVEQIVSGLVLLRELCSPAHVDCLTTM